MERGGSSNSSNSSSSGHCPPSPRSLLDGANIIDRFWLKQSINQSINQCPNNLLNWAESIGLRVRLHAHMYIHMCLQCSTCMYMPYFGAASFCLAPSTLLLWSWPTCYAPPTMIPMGAHDTSPRSLVVCPQSRPRLGRRVKCEVLANWV